MTSDDGTQARTIESIERAMAVQDLSNKEIASYLGLSESQWGNVKAGRQVLAPWMMRKIAKRLGSAASVVKLITAATGETVGRDADDRDADLRELPRLSARATALFAELGAVIQEAGADGVYSGDDIEAIQALLRAASASSHRLCSRPVRPGPSR